MSWERGDIELREGILSWGEGILSWERGEKAMVSGLNNRIEMSLMMFGRALGTGSYGSVEEVSG